MRTATVVGVPMGDKDAKANAFLHCHELRKPAVSCRDVAACKRPWPIRIAALAVLSCMHTWHRKGSQQACRLWLKVDVHNNLGDLWRAQGQLGRMEAQSCYQEALSIDAHYAPAWRGLGDLFREAGEHSQAIAYYQVRGIGQLPLFVIIH